MECYQRTTTYGNVFRPRYSLFLQRRDRIRNGIRDKQENPSKYEREFLQAKLLEINVTGM